MWREECKYCKNEEHSNQQEQRRQRSGPEMSVSHVAADVQSQEHTEIKNRNICCEKASSDDAGIGVESDRDKQQTRKQPACPGNQKIFAVLSIFFGFKKEIKKCGHE